MKKLIITIVLTVTALFSGTAMAQDSLGHSAQALKHSGQALKNSAQAVGHGILGGIKLTSGVVAVPFKVAGQVSTAAGRVSTQIANDLKDAASAKPFAVTDRNLTKSDLPPHKAIQE